MIKRISLDDIKERYDELEVMLEDVEADDPEFEDELAEIDRLRDLLDSVTVDGELVHENSMAEYAQELAEDVYGVDVSTWPCTCIDWEQAANDLSVDYTSVEYDGDTWYHIP